jgi:hypothetical protein
MPKKKEGITYQQLDVNDHIICILDVRNVELYKAREQKYYCLELEC